MPEDGDEPHWRGIENSGGLSSREFRKLSGSPIIKAAIAFSALASFAKVRGNTQLSRKIDRFCDQQEISARDMSAAEKRSDLVGCVLTGGKERPNMEAVDRLKRPEVQEKKSD